MCWDWWIVCFYGIGYNLENNFCFFLGEFFVFIVGVNLFMEYVLFNVVVVRSFMLYVVSVYGVL